MSSYKQYRYYFGIMLKELMLKINIQPEDYNDVILVLHWIFKKLFFIDTTTEFSKIVMEEYLSQIRIWVNVEFGIFLHEPNEGNVENMEMREFLNKKLK